MDAGGRVGRTGAARDHANARLARYFSVGIRHHGGTALMSGGYDVDRAVVQPVKDVEITFTWDAENPVDTLGFKTVDDQMTAGFGI